jgi:hypothetical protein
MILLPLFCGAQDLPQNTNTANASDTITEADAARIGNRIYDDRDECYAQYVNAVKLAKRWQQRYDVKVRQYDKLAEEMLTKEQVQALTDQQYAQFQKDVQKLSKANNRWKAVVWVLAGYGAAATVVAAVFIGTK